MLLQGAVRSQEIVFLLFHKIKVNHFYVMLRKEKSQQMPNCLENNAFSNKVNKSCYLLAFVLVGTFAGWI